MAGGLKLLLVILDGLGDRPAEALDGRTPLEAAHTPNLDALAAAGINGLLSAKAPGIALGSPLAIHLMLGYPEDLYSDRAVLLAVGRGLPLDYEDVVLAARFARVVPEDGRLRLVQRFVRDEEERCAALASLIQEYQADGLRFRYRYWGRGDGILYLSGGASPEVTDSDPLGLDLPVIKVQPLAEAREPQAARRTAEALNGYLAWAHRRMSDYPGNDPGSPINFLLTKWAGRRVPLEPFAHRYGLRAASMPAEEVVTGAVSEMGIEVVQPPQEGDPEQDLRQRLALAEELFGQGYDFVHLHTKEPDPTAHYCEPARKRDVIEAQDRGYALYWERLARDPGLLTVVTSDHATPSVWAHHPAGQFIDLHSGEPCPIAIVGPHLRRDEVTAFGERAAAKGGLGHLRGADLMPLLLDLAQRTNMYGMRPTPWPRLYRPREVEPFRLEEV